MVSRRFLFFFFFFFFCCLDTYFKISEHLLFVLLKNVLESVEFWNSFRIHLFRIHLLHYCDWAIFRLSTGTLMFFVESFILVRKFNCARIDLMNTFPKMVVGLHMRFKVEIHKIYFLKNFPLTFLSFPTQ